MSFSFYFLCSEKITIYSYRSNSMDRDFRGMPVTLNFTGSNCFLRCCKKEENVLLQLEVSMGYMVRFKVPQPVSNTFIWISLEFLLLEKDFPLIVSLHILLSLICFKNSSDPFSCTALFDCYSPTFVCQAYLSIRYHKLCLEGYCNYDQLLFMLM